MEKIIKIVTVFLSVFLMLFMFATNLFAEMMSSANYKIQSDDLSPGGGEWSSANYVFKDTFGNVVASPATSTSYKMKVGWQEMQEVYISVSAPDSAVMTPSIPGMTGGTAATSTAWYVITDSASGFNMKIGASTSPAMQLSGDPTHYFSNYPASPTYTWNVESENSQFGFTVEAESSDDIVDIFLDDGETCGSGSFHSETCWIGFNATELTTIINRTSRTNNSPGENETIKFQAQANNNLMTSGTYQSTVTVTVTSN